MIIDFNRIKEVQVKEMNGGTGEVTAKMYMDKEGKIINAKMTRPSNPETAKTFDALEGI